MTPTERRRADGLVARAMTVQASRLYALLVFRAELDASPMRSEVSPGCEAAGNAERSDRDAPGAK